MQEALLQYIWRNSYFDNKEYLADTNEKIIVLHPGTLNHDGGPDFTNAKIRIDGTIWVGNVEIHLRSSDWERHKHNTNPSYNNVILHVAQNLDSECFNSSNRKIPSISIIPDAGIIEKYQSMINNEDLISCSISLPTLDKSLIKFWLSSLAIERLQEKTKSIIYLLRITNNNWEEAFYIAIAKSFGLKVNEVPFEILAKSTPLKIISKSINNLYQIEALLFGQAGFLEDNFKDEYPRQLKKEYAFLKKKFQLKAMDKHLWKFLRLRPSNFPTIRIAEFSSLLYNSRNLFSKTLQCDNPLEIYDLYSSRASEYWTNHYTFGNESPTKLKSIGRKTIDSIVVNTIVPFVFVYADYKNMEEYKAKIINLLEQIHPENNRIIKIWNKLEVRCRHAADSQALLQLTNCYCSRKRCLECQIGNLILKQ